MTRPKPPDGATERMTIVLPAEVVAHVNRLHLAVATSESLSHAFWSLKDTHVNRMNASREHWTQRCQDAPLSRQSGSGCLGEPSPLRAKALLNDEISDAVADVEALR